MTPIGILWKNCQQWCVLRHVVLDSNYGQSFRLCDYENSESTFYQ